jgi:hypothetical protein
MKYRILAHSKDTGQKITLELEAQSKADAERKAKPHNVNIIRIEPADPSAPAAPEWTSIQPRRHFKFPWFLFLLALIAAALYYFWPTISPLIPHFHPPTTSRPVAPTPE